MSVRGTIHFLEGAGLFADVHHLLELFPGDEGMAGLEIHLEEHAEPADYPEHDPQEGCEQDVEHSEQWEGKDEHGIGLNDGDALREYLPEYDDECSRCGDSDYDPPGPEGPYGQRRGDSARGYVDEVVGYEDDGEHPLYVTEEPVEEYPQVGIPLHESEYLSSSGGGDRRLGGAEKR